jgi:hypothetical protein
LPVPVEAKSWLPMRRLSGTFDLAGGEQHGVEPGAVALGGIGGAGERGAGARNARAFGARQTAVAARHREIVGQRGLQRIDGLFDLLDARIAQRIEALGQQQADEDADDCEDEDEFEQGVALRCGGFFGIFIWFGLWAGTRVKKSEDAGDLLDGREPRAARPGRAARASDALAFAERGEVGERRIRRDQRQEFLGGDDFVDGEPPAKAALRHAGQPTRGRTSHRATVRFPQPGVVGMRLLALGAEPAHEPLGRDQPERRGQEKTLHAQIAQPRESEARASFVCNVESTRCPVSAARMASWASRRRGFRPPAERRGSAAGAPAARRRR